jgi:hypothetical protein
VVVDMYVSSLNLTIFEMYKRDYFAAANNFPVTLNLMIIHATAYYTRCIAANPGLVNVLGTSTGFAVYAVGEEEDEVPGVAAVSNSTPSPTPTAPTIPTAPSKVACQLCGKPNHSASTCFSLKDPETVKKLVDEMAKKKKKKSKDGATPGTPEGDLPRVSAFGYSAFLVSNSKLLETICVTVEDDGTSLIDFEHFFLNQLFIFILTLLFLLDKMLVKDWVDFAAVTILVVVPWF